MSKDPRTIQRWIEGAAGPCPECGEEVAEGDDCAAEHYAGAVATFGVFCHRQLVVFPGVPVVCGGCDSTFERVSEGVTK